MTGGRAPASWLLYEKTILGETVMNVLEKHCVCLYKRREDGNLQVAAIGLRVVLERSHVEQEGE